MKLPPPTEGQEAHLLMDWIATQPLLRKYMFKIENEGKTSWYVGRKLKALGLKAGVCDYFIPIPVPPYHGCWIELKRKKLYRISPEQRAWVEDMNNFGYRADFAFGGEHAIQILKDYLAPLQRQKAINQ